MIFLSTGKSVTARASSQGDLSLYLQKHQWEYIACDYQGSNRRFPDKWFFSHCKDELLLAVFRLRQFSFNYVNNRWHVEGIDAKQFGAMVHIAWHEDPTTAKLLGPDASFEELMEAFWTSAQVMEACMSLKFFAPHFEMIEECWCPLDQFIANRAWV